ncbi:hypothetical protein GUJ93_ZPchr0013g37557 [Zizania palustris]|uniref:Uncharacterized protein n=1 Tax=Zizania palustris TaxID=103762 RepID=A0A8J5X3B0_ZIZPA|nr:hypothetical protein GUJ93_ZPchr0013g37557 [Zizania palustris]
MVARALEAWSFCGTVLETRDRQTTGFTAHRCSPQTRRPKLESAPEELGQEREELRRGGEEPTTLGWHNGGDGGAGVGTARKKTVQDPTWWRRWQHDSQHDGGDNGDQWGIWQQLVAWGR